jgi:adenosylcobyric acid synthase
MLQGTGSDVGKSLLVAGLGRAYTRRGFKVRPFKPQNMSNNAAVTGDGVGEIGRAQALQARACRVAPSVHMNPVLLKPQSDVGAQVVVQGRVEGNATARDYHALKPKLLARVLESFAIVGDGADLVLVEGAGSAAEINLRSGDIANMGFAEAANVPVVLVGDIDRGGVIASLVGTWALLSESERVRTRGYIINKFRGDPRLFEDALPLIGERTSLACFGVVPWFALARLLPKEDAASLDNDPPAPLRNGAIKIAVPRLAHIANFDDLDPLAAEPDVTVEIVEAGRALPGDAAVVLIPGSKATLADLDHLRRQGWDIDIAAHARRGGRVVGLCGGYQMLGTRVADPDGTEGPPGEAVGLGLLPVETVIAGAKTLEHVAGIEVASGERIAGYEMHMGKTTGAGLARPWLRLDGGHDDGAVSADGQVMGSYVHGLFAADGFRRAFLDRLGAERREDVAFEARIEETLDALADHLAEHLALDRLLALAREA